MSFIYYCIWAPKSNAYLFCSMLACLCVKWILEKYYQHVSFGVLLLIRLYFQTKNKTERKNFTKTKAKMYKVIPQKIIKKIKETAIFFLKKMFCYIIWHLDLSKYIHLFEDLKTKSTLCCCWRFLLNLIQILFWYTILFLWRLF